MDVGHNASAVLRGFIERITYLEKERRRLREARKGKIKDLKHYNLPAAELVRLAKADPDRLDAAAGRLKAAAAILGTAAYAEKVELTAADSEFDPSVIEHARTVVDEIVQLDEEVSDLGADLRQVYAEVKGAGFAAPVVQRVVVCKLDPEVLDDYRETGLLFEQYWEAAA